MHIAGGESSGLKKRETHGGEPLFLLKVLILLQLLELSAQSYSALPVRKKGTIG